MRNIIIASCLLMPTLTIAAQTFTITAKIPGIPEGCKVELCANEHEVAFEGYSFDGGFSLSGQVESPVLAELRIYDKPSYAEDEYPKKRGITLMLENGADMTVEAACIDSVPLVYELGSSPLFLEPCVHVSGGQMQAHYQEWRNWIYNAERARWQAEHLQWAWQFGKRRQKSGSDNIHEAMENAVSASRAVEEDMNTMFIRQHPDYAISLMLQQERLDNAFAYSSEELDSMTMLFSGNEDKAGYEHFVKQVETSRQFTRGTHYADFATMLPDGTEHSFSDFVKPGVWNYIDFWASWCGPCRAAIPAVNKLYSKADDKINIVSISVDRKHDDWKEAMVQEQMPWTQAIATREATKLLKEKYKLSAIPFLVIIDPDGNIQMATHTPAEADVFVTKQLKQ